MFPSDLARSYLPLDNALGFGVSDFFQLLVAALLILLVCLVGRHLPAGEGLFARVNRLGTNTPLCMLLLAVLPVALRLALLQRHPAPIPAGADDFSYLLLGETLANFRLSNQTHQLRPFFEQIFVLQQPTHSSIYPLGQGLALALGAILFGHPWAGVLLSTAALCSLTYWMLRAWVSPGWALLGGTLAVLEFGPLCSWTNCYWGGGVSAIAGCLIFGALPRMRTGGQVRAAILLGSGLGLEWLTRPFEFILLTAGAVLFFLPDMVRQIRRRTVGLQLLKPVLAGGLILLPVFSLSLLQNKKVTGSWTTMPYQLSRYQYGVPATFTFQRNPAPHNDLTAEEKLDYAAQTAVHGYGIDTPATYFARLASRVRYYRFFLLVPLSFALPAFLFQLRERRYVWIALTLLTFSLGSNFYPYFYPHYIAAVTCLFVLLSVSGLERISRLGVRAWPVGRQLTILLTALCVAQFTFWYGVHLLAGDGLLLAITKYETWNFINYGDPEGRVMIKHRLASEAGKQLVVVRFGPRHGFHEWIQNTANIDASPVVWAHDLGELANEALRRYYPDRRMWLLEPDVWPPQLNAYPEPKPVPPASPAAHRRQENPFPSGVNPFESVH